MRTLLFMFLIIAALLVTALFGGDGIYVGLFADEKALAAYPFGTEHGWSYHNNTNYMISGIIYTLHSWLPLWFFLIMQRLKPRAYPPLYHQ